VGQVYQKVWTMPTIIPNAFLFFKRVQIIKVSDDGHLQYSCYYYGCSAVLYHVNIFGIPNIKPYYEDLCVTCLVSYNIYSIGMADNNK